MTTLRRAGAWLGAVPTAVAALLLAGCGSEPAGALGDASTHARPTSASVSTPADATSPSSATSPSVPVNFPCPGESSSPTPPTSAPADPTAPPTDHYAENHGFREPIPLVGQSRCDGLKVTARIRTALEPLSRRGDFRPGDVRTALTGLGYPAGKVRAYQDGPTGVGFVIDIGASPWCVQGMISRGVTEADAFGGYPDTGGGCEPRSGGH